MSRRTVDLDEMVDRYANKARDWYDKAVMSMSNKTENEKKVCEALSRENWGASTTLLTQIADMTHDYHEYAMVMKETWSALEQPARQWRQIFKALTLLEFLVKNGSERCVDEIRSSRHKLRGLSSFSYEHKGVEKGAGVREKSKALMDLLEDDEEIEEEREKARELRGKYTGISSSSYGGGGASRRGKGRYGEDFSARSTAKTKTKKKPAKKLAKDDDDDDDAFDFFSESSGDEEEAPKPKKPAKKKPAKKPAKDDDDDFDFGDDFSSPEVSPVVSKKKKKIAKAKSPKDDFDFGDDADEFSSSESSEEEEVLKKKKKSSKIKVKLPAKFSSSDDEAPKPRPKKKSKKKKKVPVQLSPKADSLDTSSIDLLGDVFGAASVSKTPAAAPASSDPFATIDFGAVAKPVVIAPKKNDDPFGSLF